MIFCDDISINIEVSAKQSKSQKRAELPYMGPVFGVCALVLVVVKRGVGVLVRRSQ